MWGHKLDRLTVCAGDSVCGRSPITCYHDRGAEVDPWLLVLLSVALLLDKDRDVGGCVLVADTVGWGSAAFTPTPLLL